MDQLSLNIQANQIEQILHDNGLIVRVAGGDAGPRMVNYRVQVYGNQASLIPNIRRLDQILALRLGVQGEICIQRDGGQIRIGIPHNQPRPTYLESLYRTVNYPPHTMVVGVGDDLLPVALRLEHPGVAHALVAGTTGSGKTTLMTTMILSLAANTSPEEARLVAIDPKGGEFDAVSGLPHLITTIRGVDDGAVMTALSQLLSEMEQRSKGRRQLPRLYVFIDELADLMAVIGKPFRDGLTRLAQRGRGAGIHIIAGTQKPTSESLGSLVIANFPTRVVGAVTSANDAVVASGVSGSGAEKLMGQGDFLLFSKAGPRPVHFQAATIRDRDRFIGQHIPLPDARRQWEVVDDEPRHSFRKLIPFPTGRGGHNRKGFTPEQIEDARRGLSAWELRQKYNLSGSRAGRLAKDYRTLTAKAK